MASASELPLPFWCEEEGRKEYGERPYVDQQVGVEYELRGPAVAVVSTDGYQRRLFGVLEVVALITLVREPMST